MQSKNINRTVLVTGAAGFIGYHVSQALLSQGIAVIGVDNLNPYYDVRLKHWRLERLKAYPSFVFEQIDIADKPAMEAMWARHCPTEVIHLAAQAGVRYSIQDPFPYIHSNVQGFMVMLELCRHQEGLKHLVYASTSSVYGTLKTMPFDETMRADTPMSLYAATKRGNELMAQSYYNLYNLPATGLRFFTVYGPWGRPDMSLFKFTKAILEDQPLDVFNHGQMSRDYTYVDDIVQGILAALDCAPKMGLNHHPLYNLANGYQETLLTFIEEIEKCLGKKAKMNMLPMQLGDVPETSGNIGAAQRDLGYSPKTGISEGIKSFVDWYTEYYLPQQDNQKTA